MCQIVELLELCEVAATKTPSYTKKTIDATNPVFVYVKNYCHWSKQACEKLLPVTTLLLDMVDKEFVTYEDGAFEQACTDVPTSIVDAFVTTDTVPQIFVYTDNQWEYVGGCETLMGITIVNARSSEGNSCIQTPAVALKW